MTRLRPCIGCGLLVSPGPRCAECRRKATAYYDRARPEHHALYRTQAWRRLAAEVREGARRCHWCLKPTLRLVADHVIPLEQRPDLAMDRTNLVAACVACNTRRGRNAKLPEMGAERATSRVRPKGTDTRDDPGMGSEPRSSGPPSVRISQDAGNTRSRSLTASHAAPTAHHGARPDAA